MKKFNPEEMPKLEDYNTREEWFKDFNDYTCTLDPMSAIECIFCNDNVEETE